ncbi:hypothetical protein [Novosphingobium mathurense]|uniref:Uncharacterized protein n=1 Tax=Novosphingobium mathurense TaxID=428990 RepID=A0A1U6IGY4_9SPHN|nr:hypothetical protein [Novosphingobium mathurense]SLK07281.1 hypothetical protein SAMN06295987_106174 [Novosphingobium mathurense]
MRTGAFDSWWITRKPPRILRDGAAASRNEAWRIARARAEGYPFAMTRQHHILPLALPFALVAVPALLLASCKSEEPAPEASASATGKSTEAVVTPVTVESWLDESLSKDLGGKTDSLQYARAEADLDGDGVNEVLAYVGGPMMCGTGGCNLVVLKRDGEGYRQVGDLSVVQLPVGVLSSKTNGWKDLAVSVSGGGRPGGIMRVPFDGKAYARNPTVSPAEPVDSIGKELIADKPLKPLKPGA